MLHLVLVFCLVFAVGSYGDPIETRPIRDWGPNIINGIPADPGEFPSQISLQYTHTILKHNCGASIISADWVLTAASCVKKDDLKFMRLLAATNDLDNPGTFYPVERFVIHEKYDVGDSWVNDIALVKVATPFNLTNPLTQPIQLPVQGQETPDGTSATVIGWGRVAEGTFPSNQLRKVDVAIVNVDVCHSVYRPEPDEPGHDVYPTEICADLPQATVGTCADDAGGPLIVNKEVVGIVSWPKSCTIQGFPTVYTRVSAYRDWIATTTGV